MPLTTQIGLFMIIFLLFITASCFAGDEQQLLRKGKISLQQKKPFAAKNSFKKILEQNPRNIDALHALGITSFYENDLITACDYLKRCAMLQPNNVQFIDQYATLLDHTGEFEQARDLFEKLHDYNRKLQKPWIKLPPLYIRTMDWYYVGKFVRTDSLWWHNGDISGKTVLLDLSSQWNGRGDTIQIIRYANHLHEAGAQVIAYVRNEMIQLLNHCPFLHQVISKDNPKPPADITYALTTDKSMVLMRDQLYEPSKDVPYIFSDPILEKKWEQRLQADPLLKIGICWQSVKMQDHFSSRVIPGPKSVELKQLAPLLYQKGISFYSLQINEQREIEEWNKNNPDAQVITFDDLDSEHPFMDSAALIKQLDLVISVDTSIAHLAGAMGIPVWVMLSYASDFRWLEQERTDTPLYPTMKLMRQPKYGDWHSVVWQIKNNLRSNELINYCE